MTDKVKWANGMDGDYVYEHDGVRAYWTRQFRFVSSNVTSEMIDIADEFVYHYFHLQNNQIAEFDIGEKVKN